MENTRERSKRAAIHTPIAALMGVVIGLIAGLSLSHPSVSTDASLRATAATAIAATSSSVGAVAVADRDVSDIQLD